MKKKAVVHKGFIKLIVKLRYLSLFTYQLMMNKLKKQLFKKQPFTHSENTFKQFHMLSAARHIN